MSTIKIFVLDLGLMKMDKNLLVAKSTLANRKNPNRPAEFSEFPVPAYVIEHPEGLIMFDTGCNPNSMGTNGHWPQEFQDYFPYSGDENSQLPSRLKQLGMRPEDFRFVVLSHMHNDHAGCLHMFRKAQVYAHEDEFYAALKAYALHNQDTPYIWKDTDDWIKAKLDWHLVDRGEGDFQLLDGVTVLNLGPGHAPGMLGLHVILEKHGGVILVQDAIYCSDVFGPPPKMQGVVYDSLGWLRTVERIRKLAQQTKSQIWFGHDLEQFTTLKKSTEGYYD